MIKNNDLLIFNNLKKRWSNDFFVFTSENKIVAHVRIWWDELKNALNNYEKYEVEAVNFSKNFKTNNTKMENISGYLTDENRTSGINTEALNSRMIIINSYIDRFRNLMLFNDIYLETLIENGNVVLDELFRFNVVFPNYQTFYEKLKDLVFTEITHIPLPIIPTKEVKNE